MKPDAIRELYDASYAREYETKFLTSPLTSADVAYELELLATLTHSVDSWLDVACGTGYFMQRFPQITRTGIDISPAMLDIARSLNPGANFIEQNYLETRADWVAKFDLVSCMWYAYCLVDTIPDLMRLIENLSAWTSERGTCFVPLADPQLITGYALPYRLNTGGFAGGLTLTGIIWSFSEQGGDKVHANLIAPHPDFMVEAFLKYFEDVKLVRYPPAFPGWIGRPAIIAQKKRA